MTTDTHRREEALHFVIRDETPEDAAAIEAVTRAAFREHPFSQQTEHLIVRGLREAGALRLSLVATLDGEVVAHAAASPVAIGGAAVNWCGLGPVSVGPVWQRRGIGSALVRSALRRLHERGAAGCVVLGDPGYYRRFGFAPQPGLVYPGPPPDHFMAVVLHGPVASGEVTYHPAFDAQP